MRVRKGGREGGWDGEGWREGRRGREEGEGGWEGGRGGRGGRGRDGREGGRGPSEEWVPSLQLSLPPRSGPSHPPSLAPSRRSGSLPPSLTASYTLYSMIMYSRSVKFSGITSPIRPPTLRNITSSNVER